jgi:methylglutaconyl-CoA hydratase
MTYRHLDVRRHGAVERVTLNRPEVRNAFNDEVVAELSQWAASLRESPDIRVAILAGAGATFCAGADVEWMSRMLHYSAEQNRADAAAMAAMFHALDTLPVPLVGRVQGAALGGGAGLAAICDIVVAEDAAFFGFTEVRLGILPAVISPFAIAKIGVSAARELFLTGARFDAARAKAIGLVHAVETAKQLDVRVEAYVNDLLHGAASAIARTKELIPQVIDRPPTDVRGITSEAIADQRVSPDGQEGLKAFLEKRKPHWVAATGNK